MNEAQLADRSMTDHALLCAGIEDQRLEQAAEFRRVVRWTELVRRWEADLDARRAEQPHFTQAPTRELVVEAGPLSGFTEGRIRSDVGAVRILVEHLPQLLAWGLEGRIDLHRATVAADAITYGLADDHDLVPAFAQKITAWFAAHVATVEAEAAEGDTPPSGPALIVKTRKQIQSRVGFLVRALRTRKADEEFRRKFADRRVDKRLGDDGMGSLHLTHDVATIAAIDRHLDLLARDARRKGDPRTIAQLRADFAADLLLGRITITELGEIVEHETGRWARPVINVTVPMATLAGASDEPGSLDGTTYLPAPLVRALAFHPSSTWYRLVTDPLRGFVELSTEGYQPGEPLWREVVARWGTCFGPTCDLPATRCDLDHNVPWPRGQTSSGNLAPGCGRHHPAKHVRGSGIEIDEHGVRRWRTRAGFTHRLEPDSLHQEPLGFLDPDHPGSPDADAAGPPVELLAELADLQPGAEELRDALARVRIDRREAEVAQWLRREEAQLFADFRAACPDVPEEAIVGWIEDDPEPGVEGPPTVPHAWTAHEETARLLQVAGIHPDDRAWLLARG